MLPWWIEHGHWLGWLLAASGGVIGLWVWRAGQRRKLERELSQHRAALGEVSARVDPGARGRVALKGRLRGEGDARLQRPEDGAPVLAYGVIYASVGPAASAPWTDRCLITERVPGLALELDDGTRVSFEGPVELVLGSSETRRPVERSKLPADVKRRLGEPPELAELAADAPLAFRSLRDGDEVVVSGRLERRGRAEGADYRSAATSHALVGGADEHEVPLRVMYAKTPALRGRHVAPELACVAAGVCATLAVLAASAAATDGARSPYEAATLEVPMESGRGEIVPPFDDPPTAYLLGVLSPLHRDDALTDLASRYERMAPATERAARRAFAARELVSCEGALRERRRRGRYEEVLAAAPRCDEAGAARHEVAAALVLGRLETAAGVLRRDPDVLEPVARAELHIMRRDWESAAEALAAYVEERRRLHDPPELDTSAAQRQGECLRRSLLRRAGRADLEPSADVLEDVFCRVAWADLAPPDERLDLLGEPSTWYAAHDLPWLLAAELGHPTDDSTHAGGAVSVFDDWVFSQGPTYSGLHAAARHALGPRGRSARVGLGVLRARAASFELFTGDPERAARFAELALSTAGERHGGTREAAASVLAFLALRRGDVAGAREAARRVPREYWREDLLRWIALLGERNPSELGASDWVPSPSAGLANAALSGDGAHFARVLSLRDYELLDQAVLLAPLVERDRDVLREHVRWGRGAVTAPRLRPMRKLRAWAGERWLALGLDDAPRVARAKRMLDRFRGMVLRRETAVPMLLVGRLY